MNYAISDGTASGYKIGSIKKLFPNVSFTTSGPNTQFLTDHDVKEVVETLTFTTPTQKIIDADPYLDGDKVYIVKVENTTTEEQTALKNAEWENVRNLRNTKLKRTDWRASSDLTLSDEWKTYRQALRDVPTQSDPYNITWPTEPT
tara:strand:- start:27 stop:464 length:438 start_codon:yes stop_codon:yes gene_type:complete